MMWCAFAEFAFSLARAMLASVSTFTRGLGFKQNESTIDYVVRTAVSIPRPMLKATVQASCVILFASSVLNFNSIMSSKDGVAPPSMQDVGPPLPYFFTKSIFRKGHWRHGAVDAFFNTNSYGLFRTMTGNDALRGNHAIIARRVPSGFCTQVHRCDSLI